MGKAFNIEECDPKELKRIYVELSGLPKATLIGIAKDFSEWKWPVALGDPPIVTWEDTPEYRRPWMSKDTVCRSDFIDPYMAVIRLLGVKNEDIFER